MLPQSSKRLQLIKEISPSIVRLAALWNANAAGPSTQLKQMQLAAPRLGITLQSLPIRSADEMSLRSAIQAKAQAIVTVDDPVVQSQRTRMADFAIRQRLPLMGEFRPMSDSGGLMSYAPNQVDMWRRVAAYVDKILKGAKPADLPVAQPTKFELVINLKTAKTLGISFPLPLLGRADEVIE